mmetsp:Transcript_36716/g.85297  ORF Transcript_36716/g.85297 Transcript_36716/m.85297 type:complete len:91 (-) Transcript_36716:80-352(-)
MMGDTWRFALGTMVKAEMYDEAIALCERLFPMFEKLDQRPYWHRACLSIIIFQLTLNDYPAADRAFTEYCGCDSRLGPGDRSSGSSLQVP